MSFGDIAPGGSRGSMAAGRRQSGGSTVNFAVE